MKEIFYIGRFPPPYGGATIKNDILYKELSKKIDMEMFDTSKLKKSKKYYISLLQLILNKNIKKGIICVSNNSLLLFSKLINIIRPQLIKDITLFIVGGTFDEIISEKDINLFKRFKNIYVESNVMRVNLKNKGFKNVDVVPNARNKYIKIVNDKTKLIDDKTKKQNQIVYIGRICEEKGVLEILKAAELLEQNAIDVMIDFYGPIDKNIELEFKSKNNELKNISYKGIIQVDKDNIYEILEKYDISLYPTKWKNEGIPGSIVESKIAGNAVICSKWKNNDNLVNNLKDGIVLNENTVEDLYNAIKLLKNNQELLKELKVNSKISAENYYIENYIDKILDKI